MNYSSQSSGGTSVIISNGKGTVVVNGVAFPIPNYVLEKENNTSIINNQVYINGYELKENEVWKKTLKARWHKYF